MAYPGNSFYRSADIRLRQYAADYGCSVSACRTHLAVIVRSYAADADNRQFFSLANRLQSFRTQLFDVCLRSSAKDSAAAKVIRTALQCRFSLRRIVRRNADEIIFAQNLARRSAGKNGCTRGFAPRTPAWGTERFSWGFAP